MTITLQDLKHLELMAELEDQPASTRKKRIVAAKEEVAVPSTLNEKLLFLTAKLHSAGFTKQAEDLEENLIPYLQSVAAVGEQDPSLLYRAHSETGEELVDFAHPEGDVEVSPAADHNGDVETINSKHRKIVDSIQRTAQDAANDTIKNVIIAQKFQAMADVISSKYLSANEDDAVLKNKKVQDFVAYASRLYEICQTVIQQFNNSLESPRVAAFSRLGKIINTQQYKVEDMEDLDGYIDLMLKTLERAAPVKKAYVLDLLKKTLKFAEDRKHTELGKIGADVVSSLKTYLKPIFNTKFDNVKIYNNNRTIGEQKEIFDDKIEKLEFVINQYNMFPEAGKENAIGSVAGKIDAILKSALIFADLLNLTVIEAAKSSNSPFDNPNYPIELKNMLNGINHRFLSFYDKYITNDDAGSNFHSSFFTPAALNDLVSPEVEKLNRLVNVIKGRFLTNENVKKNTNISSYLSKFSEAIFGYSKELSELPNQISNTFKSGQITINEIKEAIQGKSINNILDATTINNFKSSISSLNKKLAGKLKELIDGNSSLGSAKEELLDNLNNLNHISGNQ